MSNSMHEFKNFHRLLCERFGYVHDEKDWQRDQLSLIEHIAKTNAHETEGEPDSQLEYSIKLQRLIERFCAGDELPYPELHHHRLLAKLGGARAIQRVYTRGGIAAVTGVPGPDHDCDAMRCSSIEHIVARVPHIVDEKVAQETSVRCANAPPHNLALQKGAEILWERQFKGTPWEGKVGLIRPESMEEYRVLALQVWRAVSEAMMKDKPSDKATKDQAAIDANALADARRMYEAEHGEPFPGNGKGNGI